MSVLFLIFLTLIRSANCQDTLQIFHPQKPFPQEFIYLYESAQINEYKNGHKGAINFAQLTKKLDHFCQQTRPEEITLYFKTIIYKKFLESQNSKIFDFDLNKSVTDKFIEILANNRENGASKRYLSLSHWLISAIFYDIKDIMSDPMFTTYKLAKEQSSSSGIKIYNKIGLLAPLISSIIELSPDDFNAFVSQIAQSLLENINTSIDLFAKVMPNNDPKITKNKSCFENLKFKLVADKNKNMESILQKIEVPAAPNMIIKNYWVPKTAPVNYPTPDPNYSPPAQLPKPINDWN